MGGWVDPGVDSRAPLDSGTVSPARIALRAFGTAAAALLLVVGVAGPAFGHAELDTADPADKAVLQTPPTTITMTFTEDLDPSKSSFKLLAPDGSTVGTGGATAIRTMSLDNLELAPGAYQIKWTSASADDGDIERGELTFTVAQPAASASVSPTQNDVASPSPSASSPAAATPAATPAPSAAPSAPASSTSDVLLPIIVGLILVGVVGAFVLRRSRGA
jgi:methionine-rich copper-binding protein CopC